MAAAVVARPEKEAAARDVKRRERTRHRDEMRSPDAKRCRRDDAHYRVSSSSSAAGRKRKRERDDSSVRGSRGGDRRRRYPTSYSRVSCTRRSHAGRTPRNRDDDERTQRAKRRRSRSPASERKTRPQVPCVASPQAQPQTLPMAAPYPLIPIAAALGNNQPPEDLTEQFEETELRRREIQRRREEARREMDKVVQSVYFNDPFVSLMDILKAQALIDEDGDGGRPAWIAEEEADRSVERRHGNPGISIV